MQPLALEIVYRGQVWRAQALTVAGACLTIQFFMHDMEGMPSSVLEFSLWDARCKQLPDLVLSQANIERLRPWLRKQECPWRIGWKRKQSKSKTKKLDPRQGNLF